MHLGVSLPLQNRAVLFVSADPELALTNFSCKTRIDPIWHPMKMHFLSAGYQHLVPPTTTAHVDQRPQMSSRLPHNTNGTHLIA